MPDLVVALQGRDGREIELPSGGRGRSQREWAEVWSVAGVTAPSRPIVCAPTTGHFCNAIPTANGSPAEGTEPVRFYRVYFARCCPRIKEAIVRRTMIGELTP